MPEIRLLVREPDLPKRTASLASGATIGRSQGNTLVLKDPAASRNHLRLVYEGNTWFVEDLGSASGTTVDSAHTLRKGQRIALRNGMTLLAGDTTLEVKLELETVGGTVPKMRKTGPDVPPEVERTMPVVPPFAKPKAPAAPREPAAARETPPAVPPTPSPERTQPGPPGRGLGGAPPPRSKSAAQPPPAPAPRAAPAPPPPPLPPTPKDEDEGTGVVGEEPAPAPAEDDLSPPQQVGEGTRRIETKELAGMQARPKLMARNARLIVVGEADRRSVAITRTPFGIGRGGDAELMLADDSISTEHARLLYDADADAFELEDLGSRNGSFVGKERLAKRTPHTLRPPVWLRFGAVEAFLVDDRSSSSVQEKCDRRACDFLVRSGRLASSDRHQAVEAARAGRRHIGEMVLQQTNLTVAEWAEAVARAYARKPGAGTWLLALSLLAIGVGLAYWFIYRG